MSQNKLIKISSISKKLVVGLLGAFLLLFLLFHMCANLLILREDDGAWYSAFCHFMGTNIFVKIFEVVLMAVLLFHIICTLVLWFQNRKARGTERYHVASKSKTAIGSKMMALTGVLIIAFLALHFLNFYLVKMKVVQGTYMVEVEKVETTEVVALASASQQQGVTPEEFMESYKQQMQVYMAQMDPATVEQMNAEIAKFEQAVPVAAFMSKVAQDNMISEDGKYIKKINKEDRDMLMAAIEDADVEPDFYTMARDLFKNRLYCCVYIIFFVILWIHLRHAFESVFQTWGLQNYTYFPIINFLAIVYAWVIVLGFAAVPVCVLLFF